ncbi:MAG: inositol monophosphatase family protein [Thainema sp.]
MSQQPTPREILATLLPTLKLAARYAQQIQPHIRAQPSKDYDNIFAAALSDADLSVQTMIEVALLGTFPDVRFFGEEYEKSYNTKYFRAITLGEPDDYLITLDPIDGTRFYLDGHANYCVILTILNRDEYEAAIALFPAQDIYYYAFRGEGAYRGTFANALEDCLTFHLSTTSNTVYLTRDMESDIYTALSDRYQALCLSVDYSAEQQIPNHTDILSGQLCGSVLENGKFIDSAAIAFLAQEAGGIVTTWDGSAPPPLCTSNQYQRPGLLIAASPEIHRDLLQVVQSRAAAF